MKKKKAAPKKAAPADLTRAVETDITTQYRAWCDTDTKWISGNWTTQTQANQDAQTHIDLGHLVEVKQKVG